MREDEFSRRLRDALGEPPPLAAPVLGPRDVRMPRAYPRAMAPLAIALAFLLILVLVVSRISLHPAARYVPAGKPTPTAQAAADSFPCALPMALFTDVQNPPQNPVFSTSLGFVNIPGGTFKVDPAATVSDLPSGSGGGPVSYSAQLKRWVPASSRTISPDGISYTYVVLTPAGATYSNFKGTELHVFDVATNADRKVWTDAAEVDVIVWDSAGILVRTSPPKGGMGVLYHIDPSTGSAVQAPFQADPEMAAGAVVHGGHYSYLGPAGQGRSVFRIGSRDPGTKYSVVIIESGQATTLYAGTVGDAMDFDPETVYSDQHGLWLGNVGATRVWLWTHTSGLQSFRISGLPPVPSGYSYTNLTLVPAGVCVPGTFAGAAA